jgi:hypothetical protein
MVHTANWNLKSNMCGLKLFQEKENIEIWYKDGLKLILHHHILSIKILYVMLT